MRITGGELKRRLLEGPPDTAASRPMPDRVKEALCNILRGHFEDATVFDAFAGVGTMGLEAVSRGAARVVMVEKDKRVAAALRRNIDAFGVADRCEVVVGDALGAGALARCPSPVHLAFFDPPYVLMQDGARRRRVLAQVEQVVARLDPAGFAVVRTPWPLRGAELALPGAAGPETHEYGGMALHLYMRAPGTPNGG
ncbi:MAG: RsmD family RNA methyltransferase [Phycisphaerales bacterium]